MFKEKIKSLKFQLKLYKIKYFSQKVDFKPNGIDYSSNIPILISGQIQRSGGSLFSQLFDGHDEILPHPFEIFLTKNKYQKYNARAFYDNIHPFIKLSREGYSKGKWYGDKSSFIFYGERFVKDFLERKFSKKSDIISFYFNNFFKYWKNLNAVKLEKKLIAGFSPRLAGNQLESFMKENERVYFVHIFRDPYSWWASSKKHGAIYNNISAIESEWKPNQFKALKMLEKFPHRTFIISFENLIKNPDKVMKKFCSIFDLSFNNIMISPTFNKIPIGTNSSYKEDGNTGKINTAPLVRYKKILTKLEIDNISLISNDIINIMKEKSSEFLSK